ncbi:MAG: hypothetical protein QM776_12880 [Rhodocyclaceae bacterium]
MKQPLCRIVSALAATLLLISAPGAGATEVRIDATGFDVYVDDSLVALFGVPDIVDGVSLVFTAPAGSFEAQSALPAWTFSGDSFGLRIVADAGYFLSSASVLQAGQLHIDGAASEIYAGGVVRTVDSRYPTVSYAPMVGSGVAAVGAAGGVYERSWETVGTQLLSAGATDVQVTIDSLLGARAGSSSGHAFVSKQFVSLSVVSLISPVPEIPTWSMMVLGAGMFAGIARRRAG